MKTTPLRFSLALLVTATALSGCNWETTEYDEYAGPKGYVTVCHGYCQITFNNQTDCETAGGTWFIAGSSNETNADNSDNDADASTAPTEEKPATSGYARCIIPNHKCTAIGATWDNNTNTCLIEDENQCHTFDPYAIWYGRNATDLGNGRYIVKYGDKYICGAYDFVSDLKNLDSNFCLQTEIDELTLQLEHNICSASAVNCVGLTLKSDDPEAKNTNIGLCSKCGEGQAECTVDGTSINTQCFDIMNNNERCGGCNIACGAYETCVNGVCVESEGWCEPECDTEGGFICVKENNEYKCVCSNKYVQCGDTCYDPSEDESCGVTVDKCDNIQSCSQQIEGSICRPDENSISGYSCQCQGENTVVSTYRDTTDHDNQIMVSKCLNFSSIEHCGATYNSDGVNCRDQYPGMQCVETADGYECQAHCTTSGQIYCKEIEDGFNKLSDISKNELSFKDLSEIGYNSTTKCIMPENTLEGKNCGLINCNDNQFNNALSFPVQCSDKGMKCKGDGSTTCVCRNDNEALCNGTCTNTADNNDYCGAKGLCNNDDPGSSDYEGTKCDVTNNFICKSGKCVCNDGFILCNGNCILPETNILYCGANLDKTQDIYKGCTNQFGVSVYSGDDCTQYSKDPTNVSCSKLENEKNASCKCVNGTVPYPYFNNKIDDDTIKAPFTCVNPKITDYYCGLPTAENLKDLPDCTSYQTATTQGYCKDGECLCQLTNGDEIAAGYEKPVPEEKLSGTAYENSGPRCIDPMNDSNYCQICVTNPTDPTCNSDKTYACIDGYSCIDGTCLQLACKDGLTACFGKCIDLSVYHIKSSDENPCSTCEDGYCDDDNNLSNGCPLNKSLLHLSSCPLASDTGKVYCDNNWADSNSNWKDGCDINLINNTDHCGSLNNSCTIGAYCAESACRCTDDYVAINECSKLGSAPVPDQHIIDNPEQCLSYSLLHFTKDCQCENNYADLDGLIDNGCETNLNNDNNNCGAIGNKCTNGSQCVEGACICTGSYTACPDLTTPNENNILCYNLNLLHMKSCTECMNDWVDADGNISNGCEVNLKTDILNCGSLNKVCSTNYNNAIPQCINGSCSYKCLTNYDVCNNLGWGESNCVSINTSSRCGSCSNSCSYPNNSCDTQTTTPFCCRKSNDDVWQDITCCSGYTKCKRNGQDRYKCVANGDCGNNWSKAN